MAHIGVGMANADLDTTSGFFKTHFLRGYSDRVNFRDAGLLVSGLTLSSHGAHHPAHTRRLGPRAQVSRLAPTAGLNM